MLFSCRHAARDHVAFSLAHFTAVDPFNFFLLAAVFFSSRFLYFSIFLVVCRLSQWHTNTGLRIRNRNSYTRESSIYFSKAFVLSPGFSCESRFWRSYFSFHHFLPSFSTPPTSSWPHILHHGSSSERFTCWFFVLFFLHCSCVCGYVGFFPIISAASSNSCLRILECFVPLWFIERGLRPWTPIMCVRSKY